MYFASSDVALGPKAWIICFPVEGGGVAAAAVGLGTCFDSGGSEAWTIGVIPTRGGRSLGGGATLRGAWSGADDDGVLALSWPLTSCATPHSVQNLTASDNLAPHAVQNFFDWAALFSTLMLA